MSVLPVPEPPGPQPGQPGHFTHTDWLTASVKALDGAGTTLDTRTDALEATAPGTAGQPFAYAAARTAGIAAGTPGAHAGTAVTVTFPAGRFTAIPIVVASCTSSGYLAGSTGSETTTSFSCRIYNPTNGAPGSGIQGVWHAVQMTAATGEGRVYAPGETFTATCRTPGCANEGIEIPDILQPEVAEGDTYLGVYCGVCINEITETRGMEVRHV